MHVIVASVEVVLPFARRHRTEHPKWLGVKGIVKGSHPMVPDWRNTRIHPHRVGVPLQQRRGDDSVEKIPEGDRGRKIEVAKTFEKNPLETGFDGKRIGVETFEKLRKK
jgi:hypothetical protein